MQVLDDEQDRLLLGATVLIGAGLPPSSNPDRTRPGGSIPQPAVVASVLTTPRAVQPQATGTGDNSLAIDTPTWLDASDLLFFADCLESLAGERAIHRTI
jgi:hypothetical protein